MFSVFKKGERTEILERRVEPFKFFLQGCDDGNAECVVFSGREVEWENQECESGEWVADGVKEHRETAC